jgi:hypothetical protein
MSKNLKEQLRETGIRNTIREVEKDHREFLKRYEGEDDPALTTNLKSYQDLLVIGGEAPTEMCRDIPANVHVITRTKDLGHMNGMEFDQIFFVKQTVLSSTTLEKAISMLRPGGLTSFFTENDELRDCFVETVESLWPFAETWKFVSNVGPVVVTTARGPSGVSSPSLS